MVEDLEFKLLTLKLELLTIFVLSSDVHLVIEGLKSNDLVCG